MADQKNRRGGERPAARPEAEHIERKETDSMAAYASQHGQKVFASTQQSEGITVIGEAVRRVSPENAEFLIEVTSSSPTAAQALRDNQNKLAQVSQALHALGVQAHDLQTISQNMINLYTPVMQSLPGYAMPQIGQQGFPAFGLQAGVQPDLQFGAYHSRCLVRVNIRDTARAGEIVDAATRAGAIVTGAFLFKASDETSARRATLEAAGKDARMKAETLAAATGKQIGDPISISEELIASNGVYAAFRSAMPFGFGAGAPQITGELEYYARVSASFRLQ